MQLDLQDTFTDFNFDQALATSAKISNRSTRMGTQQECGGSVPDSDSPSSPYHSKHKMHKYKSPSKYEVDPWNGTSEQDPLDAADKDSSEEEDSSSEEESSEEEDGPSTSKGDPSELTREERRAAAKAKKEAAIAKKNKKVAAPGDLPSSSEEEESDDDDTPANPNHTSKSRAQANRPPPTAKEPSKAKAADPSQLSRREREALQAQQARERYQKLHAEGKTDEARADLERLKLVREKREAEAARKQAEKEERDARAKEREEEIDKKEAKKRAAAMGDAGKKGTGIGEGPDKKKVGGKGKK
jgi:hypothetical protein